MRFEPRATADAPEPARPAATSAKRRPTRRVTALLGVTVALAFGALLAALALGPGGFAGGPPFVPGSGPLPSFDAAGQGTEVLVGAGDIGRCDSTADEETARLLDAIEGTIFTTGDNAYPNGSADEFATCYDASWGRHRDRTRLPAAGNHDWLTAGAAGYLGYFGHDAAPDGTTWYAEMVGAWRVIVLDSNCDFVGGCGDESPQLAWLRSELAASPARCIVAIWHHPRFSSGYHGDDDRSAPFWRELHAAGAELVVNGHDHDYERFAPLDAEGRPDPERGLRQIVAGTGGGRLRSFRRDAPGSEVRDAQTYGVLRLELAPDAYRWTFVPVAGQAFTDAGEGTCH